jgi:hypothetical protein
LRWRLEGSLLHYGGLDRLLLHLHLCLLLLLLRLLLLLLLRLLLLHLLELAGWLRVLLELLARHARLGHGRRLLLLLLRGIARHLRLDISRILGREIGLLLGELLLLLRWCLLGIHVLLRLLGVDGLLARPGSVAAAQKGAGAGEHDAGQAPDGSGDGGWTGQEKW